MQFSEPRTTESHEVEVDVIKESHEKDYYNNGTRLPWNVP